MEKTSFVSIGRREWQTPLLPIANERIKKCDYLGALNLYRELIIKHPGIHSFIRWNINFCCKKLLESHLPDSDASGSEYFQWVIKAIQATHDPSLVSSLQIANVSKKLIERKTLISIIMPTWNREATIRSAINSVLSQTYCNWELLICDDGSTDNTKSIVSKFSDARIRYFNLPKGNGAIARNHGLRNAKGELIAFLDSDNLWSPSFLATIINGFEEHKCEMLYTAYIDVTIENDSIQNAKLHYNEFDFNKIAFRNYIDLNTLCFRYDLLRLFGYFDPRLPRQQDWDLIMRYACRANVKGLNHPLVCYFRNDSWGQVTKTMQVVDTRSWIMKKNKGLIKRIKDSKQLVKLSKDSRIFSIKIAAPNQEEAKTWGDYHFAHSLGLCLSSLGWNYRVDCQDTWYSEAADVALVLRGRHRFFPEKNKNKVCLQWIISHPGRLKESELADYDHVLVASSVYCKKLQKAVGTPVSTLYQACVNATLPQLDANKITGDLVFVASSRKQKRDMIEWCYDSNLPLDLFGTGWEEDNKAQALLKGGYISNDKIVEIYRSYKIVLNDHWPDMKSNGFISNRIFDACGAGSLVITDRVLGIEEVFGDNVIIADNMRELVKSIQYLLNNDEVRKNKANKAQEIALSEHTFMHRAEIITKISDRYLRHYSACT